MTESPSEHSGRFAQVCTAIRENLAIAVDLVLVHNETEVRGTQPRSSLNRAIVVTAVGAWERFVADTEAAFTEADWTIESADSSVSKSHAARSEATLVAAGACPPYRTSWRARAATDWKGVALRKLESLVGEEPGARSGLTLSQHLDQWVELRNAVAHHQVREMGAVAADESIWRRKELKRRRRPIADPYGTAAGRWVLWDSDAKTKTVQAGAARACLALVLQVVDGLIVGICQTHGWDADERRLPEAWFASSLPATFRGVDQATQHLATLWGGAWLHR